MQTLEKYYGTLEGTIIIVEDGSVEYIPNADFEGKNSFTIVVITEDGDEEEIEIIEEMIPEGTISALSETGGVHTNFYILIGCLLTFVGAISLTIRKTNKEEL